MSSGKITLTKYIEDTKVLNAESNVTQIMYSIRVEVEIIYGIKLRPIPKKKIKKEMGVTL